MKWSPRRYFQRASKGPGEPEDWFDAWEILEENNSTEGAFEHFLESMDKAIEEGMELDRIQSLVGPGRRLESSQY